MSAAQRNIRLLGWFNFCNDFRVYGPVMVVYFAQVTGSYADAVLILAIAKIASSLFELPTGVFSDYVGRRTTMLSGQIANILCSLSSMFQAALATSALASAIALVWLPFRALFWLSLVPQAIGLIICFLTAEPSRHGREAGTNLLAHLRESLIPFRHDEKLRDVSIASMLGFALGEAKHMFFPAYFATLWSSWGLGIASMLTHAFAMLGFRAAGRIVHRWRELPVLLWTNGLSILLGVASTAIPTVASPAISSLASFPFGPGSVARDSLMQQAFTDRQRATMGSLISLGGNLLYAVVVFALGWCADRIGPRYVLLAAEIVTVSVAFLYWRLFGREALTGTPRHQ